MYGPDAIDPNYLIRDEKLTREAPRLLKVISRNRLMDKVFT